MMQSVMGRRWGLLSSDRSGFLPHLTPLLTLGTCSSCRLVCVCLFATIQATSSEMSFLSSVSRAALSNGMLSEGSEEWSHVDWAQGKGGLCGRITI